MLNDEKLRYHFMSPLTSEYIPFGRKPTIDIKCAHNAELIARLYALYWIHLEELEGDGLDKYLLQYDQKIWGIVAAN